VLKTVRSPTPCLYCGNYRATRSRVVPSWLDDCFPDDRPIAGRRAIACKSCLSGWIDRLEQFARPLISHMVAGNPVVLAQQNQEMLALWATKTMLSLQMVRDPDLLPTEAYRQLAVTLQPPTGFAVAVAMRPHEGKWPYRFQALGSTMTMRGWDVEPTFPDTWVDHYRAELCIGHLVIRAGANFTPHAPLFEAGSTTMGIWPVRSPERWPPARGIVRARELRIAA
jgi:hypothetical protein